MGILTPSRSSGGDSINDFNAWMKTQPWYQQFFQNIGQDMNRVNLSRGQQSQLEGLMRANGVDLGNGVHIDDAGNLNEKNRLARNVAIGAGIAAGGYFAAPYIAGALAGGGAAGGGAAAAGGASTAAGTAGSIAAASSPWMSGTTLASLAGTLGGLGANIYAQRAQGSAAERAAQAQLEASRGAGELEAKAAADQLAFLREQEARRQMEWDKSQTLNREQYERMLTLETERFNQQFGLEQSKLEEDRRRYEELQARLAPYREMGQQAFNRIGNAVTAPAAAFVPPRATVGA